MPTIALIMLINANDVYENNSMWPFNGPTQVLHQPEKNISIKRANASAAEITYFYVVLLGISQFLRFNKLVINMLPVRQECDKTST